ncbi:hypothetical protein MSIMFB_05558 [Mycobacterium simulans]|uniref:Metallothionein n=1 Tax=Mycobacterium simulans TaxID=627089 RepID=A0A7Z7NCL8_9MYCO|nr:hypothetical protein MSIMFB_05558 [Mycobacterium simulans]SON59817.1 hypothetical protein MSIMFI_01304 [Mycobacterium simulans]
MALQEGDVFTCANANCGCEVTVTKGASSTCDCACDNAPTCCCGVALVKKTG